jgi:ribosome-binding protein aMBF1 (putative translation factor)
MNSAKRNALQAAGWKLGDAADFLELDAQERQLLDARVQLALAVRRQREASHLSQKELGAKLKTSQPRVAKIERAAADVSMDQLVRAFSAAGGSIVVKTKTAKPKKSKSLRKPGEGGLTVEVVTSE